MGKFSQLLVCTALLLGPSLACADDFLVIGQVHQVTVLPKGHSRCKVPCPPNKICISNSCGCAEASVTPQQTLLGKAPGSLIVSEHLDEWCRIPMPPNEDPILVFGKPDGTLQWSYLNSSGTNSNPRFEAERFNSIGGVLIRQLPAVDGEVELGELKRRLGL